MKKIVGKYMYDTHKAQKIASVAIKPHPAEFEGYGSDYRYSETLYLTAAGKWFLHTDIETQVGWWNRRWESVEEQLAPYTLEQAQKWALKRKISFSHEGIPEPEAA